MNYHPQVQVWLDEFKELFPTRKVLFLYKAGSHFFDLNTPNSDLDYRGVYLPGPEEFNKKSNGKKENRRKQFERKTNEEKHTKNSNEDVDFLLFSYTKVLELLRSGDFNVMEMLYCPEDKILIDSPMMKELREFRRNLIVVDPSSFLGFIGKEYRRYGININHYSAQEKFLSFLKTLASKQEKGMATKMRDVWKEIKEYAKDEPMISFTTSLTGASVSVPTLKLAQTLHQWTVKIGYVADALERKLTTYGHRQKNMADSGKEYKGLYHALRLIYEATDLMDNGELEIPFTEERLKTLMAIKTGRMEQDKVHELIDNGIDNLKMREDIEDERINISKKAIEYRIGKMIHNYTTRMEIDHMIRENT